MSTAIHRRVDALRAGHEPTLVARLASGWLVLGDPQVRAGYCLLLPDPVVADLNGFDGAQRLQFLSDMAACGDALRDELGAVRINYAMFGNVEPALHAHLFPRYADEPAAERTAQPWALDWSSAAAFSIDRHEGLIERLRRAVQAHVPGAR